ncbi:MAG: ABC transporter ATP-binding protein [candidate division NC10 bacterium]|nr:ABC transporter ATP-binding protein [candidate division NC10 bacterium]
MLKVDAIHTYYGKSHILHGVSLEVGEGEVVALLGRNGVGKTTTLKSIMGLVPPRSGSIVFNGREITRLPAYKVPRLGIGYIPQGKHIFPELTVLENLKIGLIRGKLEGDSLKGTFNYFPRLEERLDQMGGSLSGGEQQMLAIARALITNPRLVLMDEPTEGLMPLLVRLMKDIIKSIKGNGVSLLLVEQNLGTALEVSDKIYIMEKGMIVYEGKPQELAEDEEVKLRYLGVSV